MTKKQASGHFGLCPHCHNTDGCFNVGRGHWFVCHEHKVKWFVGENLFDSWKYETEDEQRAIYDKYGLGSYTRIPLPQVRSW
jgi:hypothetical protein